MSSSLLLYQIVSVSRSKIPTVSLSLQELLIIAHPHTLYKYIYTYISGIYTSFYMCNFDLHALATRHRDRPYFLLHNQQQSRLYLLLALLLLLLLLLFLLAV